MTSPESSSSCSGGAPCATSATRTPGASSNASSGTRKIAPADARSAFEPERVGAALGERDRSAERVGGTQERPDVSGIGDAPERQRRLTRLARQRGGTEDADDAGRMSQRRDGGEQLGLDRLARNEELDRLDPGGRCGLDQVLTLDREEPELLALAFLRQELPDELQRRVRR